MLRSEILKCSNYPNSHLYLHVWIKTKRQLSGSQSRIRTHHWAGKIRQGCALGRTLDRAREQLRTNFAELGLRPIRMTRGSVRWRAGGGRTQCSATRGESFVGISKHSVSDLL